MSDEAPDYDIWKDFDKMEQGADGPQEHGDGSWKLVDLRPFLDGTYVPVKPDMGLTGGDGTSLLYAGKEHAIIGEMEAGKSWFCLACVRTELLKGHHVLYLHFEESNPSETVTRLMNMDTPEGLITKYFHFLAPETPADSSTLLPLLNMNPSLVILDGVNEAMSLHGWNIREEDGAANFRRRLVKPFTAVGAAILQADHVVKDREQRGRTAIGSIHKVNAVTGAVLLLENADPFGRGARGRSHLSVLKDRPGHLRQHGRKDRSNPGRTYMGEFVVDDTKLDHCQWTEVALYPPRPDVDPWGAGRTMPEVVLAAIAALNSRGEVANVTSTYTEAKIRKGAVDLALDQLLETKQITEKRGKHGARVFHIPSEIPLT